MTLPDTLKKQWPQDQASPPAACIPGQFSDSHPLLIIFARDYWSDWARRSFGVTAKGPGWLLRSRGKCMEATCPDQGPVRASSSYISSKS